MRPENKSFEQKTENKNKKLSQISKMTKHRYLLMCPLHDFFFRNIRVNRTGILSSIKKQFVERVLSDHGEEEVNYKDEKQRA